MLIAGPQVLLRLITTCLAVYSAELQRPHISFMSRRSLQTFLISAGCRSCC